MKELIDKLPIDIVLKIIPYTYKLQNKQLLNDIVRKSKSNRDNKKLN